MTMRSCILLLDNFDSFTYNLYQMVQAQTDLEVTVFRNNALTLQDIQAMAPQGIILSPGPGHPAKPEDFGVCGDVLRDFDTLPSVRQLMGVCLGHQGMAHTAGGQVVRAPEIMHGKTSQLRFTQPDDPLWAGIDAPMTVMRYHSLVVDPDTLPDCLKVTAVEAQSGLIMALRHTTRPMCGVQFHPESIGTPEGAKLLANYIGLVTG
jgi:anthranilate synthase component II